MFAALLASAALALSSSSVAHAKDSPSVVVLQLFNDTACTSLVGSKPYALTGTCQANSAFLQAHEDGLTYSRFTCSGYSSYFFEDCTADLPNGITMAPTMPGGEHEFTIPEPASASFKCEKSLKSDLYYKFSCASAQVVSIVDTMLGNCSNIEQNQPTADSYFRPCTNGVDADNADLKHSSDRFTRFGKTILQHESWSNALDCPSNVAPNAINVTLDECVAKGEGLDGGAEVYVLHGNAATSLMSGMLSFVVVAAMAAVM